MIKELINKLFKKPDNSVSFKSGMDLTGLPVVTLYQGEKKLNFLLDTGSSDSIIDTNILDSIDYTKSDYHNTLMGMEGEQKVVPLCLITLTYNNKDYEFAYLQNDMKKVFGHIKKASGVTLHGILGSNFFNQFKYILDFNELIAYSKA